MGTKRTKLTPISPELSKWPDVRQICASRGARKNCVLVLDPCNLYSLRAPLGALFSSRAWAPKKVFSQRKAFWRFHPTRYISALLSSPRVEVYRVWNRNRWSPQFGGNVR